MKIKKLVSNFDYLLFITAILLTVIGILFIYSANLNKSGEVQREYFKQLIFFMFGLCLVIAIFFIPFKKVHSYSLILYLICLVGLIATLFFPKVKGQKRFMLFSFSLQFSEFMKIAIILFLSQYYSEKTKKELKSLVTYLKAAAFVGFPMALILIQPDLGTMLVFIPIFLGISFMAGVNVKYLLYSILLLFFMSFIPIITSLNKLFFDNENYIFNLLNNPRYIIILFSCLTVILGISILSFFNIIISVTEPFRVVFYWMIFFVSIIIIGLAISYPVNEKVLKQYQKDRLTIFFNPDYDPSGKGYNIIQSQTTIGNGGLFGKGWCKGEQIQNFFLPEQATDFIFPVIAEEQGFVGSMVIIFLYSLLFFRGFLIIINAKYYWEVYMIIGLLSMYLFHIIQNIGMTIGIMPITGIPLPFLSYGGSFLVTCFIGIGIMMNIELNRYNY